LRLKRCFIVQRRDNENSTKELNVDNNNSGNGKTMGGKSQRFLVPAQKLNSSGAERQVGVEIELSAPDMDVLVATVESCFGGTRHELSRYEVEIDNTDFGTFKVEVDYDYLKKMARESNQSDSLIDDLQTQALGTLSKGLVPYEIVSPPIPVSQLNRLQELTVKLRELGCKGTRDAIWKAYGVHFNPELAKLDAASITSHLKAYVCLHEWLSKREQVDLSRRFTPYINPFGEDYVKHILPADYQPELAALIDDYLQFNPTRNRTLDMLPLFSYLDDERVRNIVDDGLIKSRPTFHFRLPNCDIDNPQWTMATAWNDWCSVEALAGNNTLLAAVCSEYQTHLSNILPDIIDPWYKKVAKWIANL
jgi:hypothetical protein